MIKVGSRVKFISDTGVGIVRSIKGNLAYVEVEDGFEIPAVLSDIVEVEIEQENAAIVKIGPSDPKPGVSSGSRPGADSAAAGGTKRRVVSARGVKNYGRVSIADEFEDEQPLDLQKLRRTYAADHHATEAASALPAVSQRAPWEVTEYSMFMMFVPTDAAVAPESADLDAYLVNDSSYSVYYNIARRERGGYYTTLGTGTIDADTKQRLKTFKRAELADVITLRVSMLPYKITSFTPRMVEAFDLELHPLKFVRANNFAENDYFDSGAVVYTLADSARETQPDNLAVAPKTEATLTAAPSVMPARGGAPDAARRPVENRSWVIDLHADEILDSTQGLAPGEIVTAQLARFTIALDGAIKDGGTSKMVFIHGVGKGKLRFEIEKTLRRDYPKLRYQDASFAEYGYGAIMIFIK